MIVVGKDYSSKTVYLAGHTGSTVNRKFNEALSAYDCCYIFRLNSLEGAEEKNNNLHKKLI